jgi:hypothetical protein
MPRLTSGNRIASAGRSASSERLLPGRNYRTGLVSGYQVVVLLTDNVRGVLWGTPISNAGNTIKATLYKSVDDGTTWTSVKAFGTRLQSVLGVVGVNNYYDLIRSVQVVHGASAAEDTIMVCCSNNPDTYDGVIQVSHDNGTTWARAKFADDQGMGESTNFWIGRGLGFPSWSFDTNGTYSVVGCYPHNEANGSIDRDIWMSVDDGDTWKRIWYQPGDGSIDAKSLHCHMARIDPDGGCWLSLGDHVTDWDHANATYGLWHSPAQPTAIIGLPETQDFASFTRVYSHATEFERIGSYPRIRPVNGIFKELASGEKYFYLGEDSMTVTEERTITRLRYDDESYDLEIKLFSPNCGGIFAMVAAAPDMWLAFSVSESNSYILTGGRSRQRLFYSRDGGESWHHDGQFTAANPNSMCLEVSAASGIWWGGRAVSTLTGPGYKPNAGR